MKSVDFYTCPLCFQKTLPYPRATLVHGHQSWYVKDCSNCVSFEQLREEHGYGVSSLQDGNTVKNADI